VAKKSYSTIVPDVQFYRQTVKCQEACPVYTDSRGYVTAVARGELELGYEIAHDPNPLSTICGRICGAPCETACRRGVIGPDYEPVAIRPVKRVLTERYGPESRQLIGVSKDETGIIPLDQVPGESYFPLQPVKRAMPGEGAFYSFSRVRWSLDSCNLAATPGRKRGRVAVIGAGPAGLTAAHDLAVLGHRVEIFEAGPKTGGMMRYGVPVYRVDQAAMDAEIQSILDLGVQIHFDTPIGKDITLSDLRQQFDAVFLGIGLMEGRKINIPGADLDGVITAVDLLLNYNLGYKVELGKRVVVVGGGNVAMDAARTALRLGQVTAEQKSALGEREARRRRVESVKTALDVARTALRLGVANVNIIALESGKNCPPAPSWRKPWKRASRSRPAWGPNRVAGANGKVSGLEVIEVERSSTRTAVSIPNSGRA
jgi:NADPH-dependent glutamate synthase beta subunit-like oxidoreductase